MQLESKENSERVFDIHSAEFPILVKCPAREYEINSLEDVSEMLLSPVSGLSMIQHALSLSVKCGKSWKRLSIESLAFIPEVAPYLIEYGRATSEFVRGYLYSGELVDQPNIIYGQGQAFDIIASAKSECELDSYRTARQNAKQSNGNK